MSTKTNVKKVAYPEKLTNASIAAYVAEKYEMSKKEAKEMVEDFFELLTSGVMNGQRVPLGNIGKVFVRIKPARPARKGRNPFTGEEIQIAAKPETKVPKI